MLAQDFGARVSEFTIGSIATMVSLSTPIKIPDTVSTLGYHLGVEWKYIIPLGIRIVVKHIILVALMVLISRPIVVGGDSNLVVARLLQGIEEKWDGKGSSLERKELAEAVEREVNPRKRWVVDGASLSTPFCKTIGARAAMPAPPNFV